MYCIRESDSNVVDDKWCSNSGPKPASVDKCENYDVSCCGFQCRNNGTCDSIKSVCQCINHYWQLDCRGEPPCSHARSHCGGCTNLLNGDWECKSCDTDWHGQHCDVLALSYEFEIIIVAAVIITILICVIIYCYRRKRNPNENASAFALMTN